MGNRISRDCLPGEVWRSNCSSRPHRKPCFEPWKTPVKRGNGEAISYGTIIGWVVETDYRTLHRNLQIHQAWGRRMCLSEAYNVSVKPGRKQLRWSPSYAQSSCQTSNIEREDNVHESWKATQICSKCEHIHSSWYSGTLFLPGSKLEDFTTKRYGHSSLALRSNKWYRRGVQDLNSIKDNKQVKGDINADAGF